jgi:hypothetical protein
MKKALIVAQGEFSRLLRRLWVPAALMGLALLCFVLFLTGKGPMNWSAAGLDRRSASLSGLVLLISSLLGIVVAALSFSSDKGGGMAGLLRSFGLGRCGYLIGKYTGILASIATAAGIIVLAGEGVGSGSGAILLGIAAVATVAIYAAWGAFFGSACRSSLSAAGSSLAFWFATMFLYEALGWALFPALPYRIAKPALALFLALDPAEALRLGAAFLSKRAAALGPEFYYWQLFFLSLPGILVAFLLFLFHSALPLLLAARASRRA